MTTETKKKVSPLAFARQVRQETLRVTWTSRKDVIGTSILVFVMVFAFAVFFLGVDGILASIIKRILGWQTL